jgi:hypothetical protein
MLGGLTPSISNHFLVSPREPSNWQEIDSRGFHLRGIHDAKASEFSLLISSRNVPYGRSCVCCFAEVHSTSPRSGYSEILTCGAETIDLSIVSRIGEIPDYYFLAIMTAPRTAETK